MNILILSCGTRVKIVQYFKKAVHPYGGRVIAADCSNLAPALYEADSYFISKRMQEDGYLEQIFEKCIEEKISGILSLIDPELSILATNEAKFRETGVTVIGSPYELCEMSLDKYRMYQWLTEHKYNCARSWICKEDFYSALDEGSVAFPVYVKPVKGSASVNLSIVSDRKMMDALFEQEEGLMIQEYLNGQEIGADVYIDLISGEVISIFTKKKIKMRAGETDKAVSFTDNCLFEYIEKFVTDAGYRGAIDIDLFDLDGEFYISEVNPRFGGGYPHAGECGVNHMRMITENLAGRENVKQIGCYENSIYMMKYNEVFIQSDYESIDSDK